MKLHLVGVVILSLIAGVGIIGNLVIIGAICIYKRLRVRSHAFIINLALADLIIVTYIMPLGIVTSRFEVNPFGDIMCQVNAFLIMTSCGVSTQTLMVIAIERYFHICKCQYHKKIFTSKLVGLYIVIMWIYTAAWTSQGWTGWTKYTYAPSVYVCIFDVSYRVAYSICLAVFGMILPMIVLVVCYYNIFRKVVKSRKAVTASPRTLTPENGVTSILTSPKTERQMARQYRLVLILFTSVIGFVVCWLPVSLILIISGRVPAIPSVANLVTLWLALSNSSLNSIVYGVFNKNFRKGYLQIVRHVFCCRGRKNDSGATSNSRQQAAILTKTLPSAQVNNRATTSSKDAGETSGGTRGQAHSGITAKDITVHARNTPKIPVNLVEKSSRLSNIYVLRPIQYDAEPPSGAPLTKPEGTGRIFRSAGDLSSAFQVMPASNFGVQVSSLNSLGTALRNDSKSNLIRRSVDGSVSDILTHHGYSNHVRDVTSIRQPTATFEKAKLPNIRKSRRRAVSEPNVRHKTKL